MTDPIRVLYVDAESGLLEIAKLSLERGGVFAVDTLTSAKDALNHLKTEGYDTITGITIVETGKPGKGARFEMTVPKGVCRIKMDTDKQQGGSP